VARWRMLERAPVQAGALQLATVEVENAGTAAWRTRGVEDGLFLSYHWLDERGNPIVWDGMRTPLERTVEPGESLQQTLALRAPYAPGGGRHPRFPHPLVCPSLLPGLEPNDEVAGLPAYRPDRDEPSMFDGRLVIRLRSRSGRRRA